MGYSSLLVGKINELINEQKLTYVATALSLFYENMVAKVVYHKLTVSSYTFPHDIPRDTVRTDG